MGSKVFLIAGGSGGHLFPAISLTETDKTFDYYFLIDHRIEKIIRKKKLKYFKIFSSSLKINPLLPIMLAKIILGFLQSLFIFIKHKPNIVVGFGGYTSIPSILAAKILKIKILIHEQNAVMGKTNRLLSYLTKNIALTFKNTKYAKNCSIHTGIPVRPKKRANSKSKLKRIFVVGGSQGAKIFSKLVPKLIENLSSRSKKKLIVVQQVRKEDMELLINSYKEMKIKPYVFLLELLTKLDDQSIDMIEYKLFVCRAHHYDEIEKVFEQISSAEIDASIIIKSTVTPDNLSILSKKQEFVYNPEFLREKTAEEDFINAKIILFGGQQELCKKASNFYLNLWKN